jgi:hypothetical protein
VEHFFQRGNGRISRFALAQFDLTQNSHNCAPGRGILKVAREVGVGTGTVQRIKQETNGPFASAAAVGLLGKPD